MNPATPTPRGTPRSRPALLVVPAASAVVLLLALVLAVPSPAAAQGPEPFRDPPFTCEVHDYGTEPPAVPGPADDPLCVRYDKTNITVSTLEVVDFLAAEPGRVAIVAVKCSYWQQDHWIVRLSPDTPPLVEWEGSYWYDARTGAAAGILRGLEVAGQPADAATFIAALRPLVGDATADQLAPYASADGGGGLAFQLPDGFAAEQQCSSATASPTPPPAAPTPAAGAPPGPGVAGADQAARLPARLPATGGDGHPVAGVVLLAAALLLPALVRRSAVTGPAPSAGSG